MAMNMVRTTVESSMWCRLLSSSLNVHKRMPHCTSSYNVSLNY